MPRNRSVYRCAECGAEHPRWAGRCDSCGEWNTLVEEPVRRARKPGDRLGAGVPAGAEPVLLSRIASERLHRWPTGLAEFDFAVGGGLVPGSLVLVGGEPGIGKSTLL
ncbi:MAG: DNA repair protein RadA, partial [Gemmatimonadota bacterium]|nr:DNA repair protein RadA [Gemmatimonadota bacterium]